MDVCGSMCAVVLIKREINIADLASFSSVWGNLREPLQGSGDFAWTEDEGIKCRKTRVKNGAG